MEAETIIASLEETESFTVQDLPRARVLNLFRTPASFFNALVKAADASGNRRRIPQQVWAGGGYRTVGHRIEWGGRLTDGRTWSLIRIAGGMRLSITAMHPLKV